MTAKDTLLRNYANLREALASACDKAGRKPEDVLLVAVSKLHPAAEIEVVANAGQMDFGENYVQEAMAKMDELRDLKLRWHMIGHVQTRKVSQVAGSFVLVHSLDSIKLADSFERRLAPGNMMQPVLIEVNIASEAGKSGIGEKDLEALAFHVLEKCPHLPLRGLMCLPPVFDSGDAARPYFAKLRNLRDALAPHLGQPLPELSMGMSGDFAGAIMEGATIVRIGTDIFGPRPKK